jgi:hypothetical protein
LLLKTLRRDTVEVDRMRIWDFYFVFPREAKHISMPRDLFSFKSGFDDPNPYEELIDAQRTFDRMRPFQLTSYKHLAAHGLIDSEQLTQNTIKVTSKPIPNELLRSMSNLDTLQEKVISVLDGPLSGFPLNGPGGLKARTRLLDFRYDPR